MGSSQGDQVEVGIRLVLLVEVGIRLVLLVEVASFLLPLDSLVALVALLVHLLEGLVALLD